MMKREEAGFAGFCRRVLEKKESSALTEEIAQEFSGR